MEIPEKFDLSKKEVVDLLADFDEKISWNGTSFYIESENFNHDILANNNIEANINIEAQKINDFLGMVGYTPHVTICKPKNNYTAGDVDINNIYAREYEITISETEVKSPVNVLKILAHEICHKFLAIHGMQHTGLLRLDEARAELCTIYMGLGLFTLNGYKEHAGYLNLEDFCHAFCVVYRSRGMSDDEIIGMVPESCKHYARTILHDMTELQSRNISELVINCQSSDYKFRRRVRLLQLLLDNMPEVKEKHELQDGKFRDRHAHLKDGKHPIQEMLLRETLVSYNLSDSRLDKCCDEIDKLIDFICSTMKVDQKKVSKEITRHITCPACGSVSASKETDKVSVFQCPKCHHFFAWDGSPLTLPMVVKPEEPEEESFWDRLLHFGKKREERE